MRPLPLLLLLGGCTGSIPLEPGMNFNMLSYETQKTVSIETADAAQARATINVLRAVLCQGPAYTEPP